MFCPGNLSVCTVCSVSTVGNPIYHGEVFVKIRELLTSTFIVKNVRLGSTIFSKTPFFLLQLLYKISYVNMCHNLLIVSQKYLIVSAKCKFQLVLNFLYSSF